MSKEIAENILAQLGGNRFKLMTGANSFSHGVWDGDSEWNKKGGYLPSGKNPGLSFRLKSNPKGIKGVIILLMPNDTYTILFLKTSKNGLDISCAHKSDMVYCDSLEEVFTAHTGLYTRI